MNTKPVALASNALLLGAVILAVLWPVTGTTGFGVVALALFLLALAFAGLNVTQRRAATPTLVRPANACTSGSCAGCQALCATPEAAR